MSEAQRILAGARSVLVVDWPSRDVPDSLVAAGYVVVVKGGPRAEDFGVLESADGTVSRRALEHPPSSIDVVYVHRPLDELPSLVAMAKALGAHAIWYQSGFSGNGTKDPRGCRLSEAASREVHRLAESAGLRCVVDAYIAEEARVRTATIGEGGELGAT